MSAAGAGDCAVAADAPGAMPHAAADGAGAVVVGRAFLLVPGMTDVLARRFPRRTRIGSITVFLPARR